jgi:quercetin dioxygenase-like cupin family protein
MTVRSEALQDFLSSLQGAFMASRCEPEVSTVVEKIFTALEHCAIAGTAQPHQLAVCSHLPDAIGIARSASPQLARLASSFEAIAPSLNWMVRSSSGPFASDNWLNGHANATIVGRNGLEDRDDITIGVSLLAPHVRYPDHRHAPEEIYLVLTPGRFQHGESEWFEPGPGGTLHNIPNIRHAMASGDVSLLAIWCLLLR